ncbi:MAG: helix-turn-helix domain-containing protein [Lachnospiraceae bacterium]|nr:helix-turn-helix domain-containing protein [Lachnospiraceae bacterium]
MISNQIIHNCIREANEISKVEFSVSDSIGNLVAQTEGAENIEKSVIISFIQSSAETQEVGGALLFKVYEDRQAGYILAAKGDGDAFLVGKLVVSQLQSLITAYKEKVDRNSFYQNLLLDNLLLVDIYNRAQKLHIEVVQPRCVFVIETDTNSDINALEMVKELFHTQKGDYVTSVNEKNIIVIKVLDEGDGYEELNDTALMLVDMLNSEIMTKVRVSYGTIVNEIKGLSKSYKEACMALDVGMIFYSEKNIIPYITLGIGRLIYQLPVNLCQMFIDEIFGDIEPGDIDDEILSTVKKFFDNSLNVSETSRQLFVHRNTLVYRIEKLQKMTGLDVRVFEDALTLKIALMVANYIKYMKDGQKL